MKKFYLLSQVVGRKEESFLQKNNLSQEDKELLVKWGKFSKAYETRSSIFRWYSRVQEIDPPNERIVFLCIALEGLLLKEESQELRYKFSLRGSYLLGELPEDRIGLMEFFKQVYDFRSSIVHCDKKQELKLIKEIGSIYKFISFLDNYTSQLLKLFIERPDLFENIDRFVLKGEILR